MINITPRQTAIIQMLPRCRCIADIGCDHGRLGAYLLQCGTAQRVIAADISAPSLAKARRLAAQLGLSGMDVRLCNGFSGILPSEFDCAVIAGMGGAVISDILAGCAFEKHQLVLQPMCGVEGLKGNIAALGLQVVDEQLVREGRRIYHLIKVQKGQYSPSPKELFLPMFAINRRDENAAEYVKRKLNVLTKAALNVKSPEINQRIVMLKEAEAWLACKM